MKTDMGSTLQFYHLRNKKKTPIGDENFGIKVVEDTLDYRNKKKTPIGDENIYAINLLADSQQK